MSVFARLPSHDKSTAYIEVSKSGFKYLCTLVDANARRPQCFFITRKKCAAFADFHGLAVVYAKSAQ